MTPFTEFTGFSDTLTTLQSSSIQIILIHCQKYSGLGGVPVPKPSPRSGADLVAQHLAKAGTVSQHLGSLDEPLYNESDGENDPQTGPK